VFAATAIVTIEVRTGSRLANAVTSFAGSGLGPNPGSSTESEAQIEVPETQLGNIGATLWSIQKRLELIQEGVSKADPAQSGIKKSLEEIDAELLDMRIAQPVDLSYLASTDCRRVQRALRELAGYRGQVDGKCDGATNASAREWQMRERRTIAPAHSGEEIERTLRSGARP
jgi:hypothetical protein